MGPARLEGVEQFQQALVGGHHHGDPQHERRDRPLVVGVEDDQLFHLFVCGPVGGKEDPRGGIAGGVFHGTMVTTRLRGVVRE